MTICSFQGHPCKLIVTDGAAAARSRSTALNILRQARRGRLANVVVLTGNGLSIALNPEFSIPHITNEFFRRLPPEHKAYVEHHMTAHTNKSNFEECIAAIETYYDALHTQLNFYKKDMHGKTLIEEHALDISAIQKHEASIRASIDLYMALILEIIYRNVQMKQIRAKLPNFTKWLHSLIRADHDVDLFTLNYDLLLETILLSLGVNYMNFFHSAGPWFPISEDRTIIQQVHKHYFDPKKSLMKRNDYQAKLYHLHGSLSSFRELKKNKVLSLKTEVIREHQVYKRIAELNIVPSIITGGRKSEKMQEQPFQFYYNALLDKMSREEHLCDELYIIGYRFADEHINRALSERLQWASRPVDPRPVKLVIIDYATSAEEKAAFIAHVNSELGLQENEALRFTENDSRIRFDGANCIPG